MEKELKYVNNLHDVNEAIRLIKELEDQKLANEQFAQVELEKINTWLEKRNNALDYDIENYKALITAFYLKQKEQNPKLKSLSVPNGRFQSRTTRKLNYDEAAMEQYLLQNHSNLIETVTVNKFNKADVKKLFKDGVDQFTGEIVDFVTETEETTYSVKTTE